MKEIVIKMDEKMYDMFDFCLFPEDDAERLWQIIKNGKVLPKGHGELKDTNKILAKTHAMQKDLESNNDRIWAINKPKYKALAYANRFIIDAEILVEADKGEE